MERPTAGDTILVTDPWRKTAAKTTGTKETATKKTAAKRSSQKPELVNTGTDGRYMDPHGATAVSPNADSGPASEVETTKVAASPPNPSIFSAGDCPALLEPRHSLSYLTLNWSRRWCTGGRRGHGTSRRGYFYACTSHHLRGRTICQNRQYLPMEMVNTAVLERARDVLLNARAMSMPLNANGTNH